MGERLQNAKLYHDAIRTILLKEWDPIGIADVPEAQDEYDYYEPQIYGMLIRKEPKNKLLDFLWWVETEHMGLCGNRGKTAEIVARLLEVSYH
jgi:hypothetical protein